MRINFEDFFFLGISQIQERIIRTCVDDPTTKFDVHNVKLLSVIFLQ